MKRAVSSIEEFIEIEAPAEVVYDQWTQFEKFSEIIKDVRGVLQLDEGRVAWDVEIGGRTQHFETQILEQVPGKHILWKSTKGPRHACVVTFQHLSEGRSKVMLQCEYEPGSFLMSAGDLLGMAGVRVQSNLRDFKRYVEQRLEAGDPRQGA